jgi:predicted AlkP superfamily pyrophosphatase or phosphodiesterase
VLLITIDGLAASYLSDTQAPLPTLRKLAANGAVAEALLVSNPTITWPNHTTLVTGVSPQKHSVLFNGMLVRPGPGQPVRIDGMRDQGELVAVPTLFDHLHRAGYRTANVNWPCTRGSITLDDNFPDVLEQITHMTPRLRAELVAAGILKDETDQSFRPLAASARDRVWTAAATYLLHARPPNLLLVHLLLTDSAQHQSGPQSPAAYRAIALADAHLTEIVNALATSGRRDQTTIFVTSDHGFAPASRLINPNVIFRRAGLIRPGSRTRVQAIAEGGLAFVYFTDPATLLNDRIKVLGLLREQEGIAAILEPETFPALGLPDPAKNSSMADMLLVAKSGCAFDDEVFAEQVFIEMPAASGTHGCLASDPRMNGIFVACGRGIKPGLKLGLVDNRDVAPTIAALLGEKMPGADGRVLNNILTHPTGP